MSEIEQVSRQRRSADSWPKCPGDHGSASSGAKSKDCRTGGQFPGRKEQAVSKWDDSGNDIIVLAKQMCMIMMEMTDFTRGKGPLKNTSDMISAAKKIAEAGSRMDKLSRTIADHCPDSACKQDLLAYLQRIALYCHQLNICSKVKAEVQKLGGELVVSGVDSAMSLIQAAKNLMNAVVQTVKCVLSRDSHPIENAGICDHRSRHEDLSHISTVKKL